MDERLLQEAVRALGAWLRPQLAASPEARLAVELFGRWLIEQARDASGQPEADAGEIAAELAAVETTDARRQVSPAGSEDPSPTQDSAASPPREATPITAASGGDPEPDAPGSWRKLSWSIGSLAALPTTTMDRGAASRVIDVGVIAQRTRLKSDACRLYIRRRAALGDPVAEPPLIAAVNALIERARELPDCFLWMVYPQRQQPPDEALERIADCYDALASCAELARAIDAPGLPVSPAERHESLQLMAEASSALRIALETTWLTQADVDQEQSHFWVRQEVGRHALFVSRHMRLEDPADPSRAMAVCEAADRARQRLSAKRERTGRIDQALKLLRYHARRIDHDGGHPHDIRRTWDGIAQLIELGVTGSDGRATDVLPQDPNRLLVPETPEPVTMWLDAAMRAHAEPSEPRVDVESTPRWTDNVGRVRELLRGRRVVMIGGQPRSEAARRIEDAFALSALDWVRLTEHGSSEPMRPAITRADTALVILLVKLVGHGHADDAIAWSRAAGVPFVWLPAGYNPEQIAAAVLTQASEQLIAR
jgi:hypothetical protein